MKPITITAKGRAQLPRVERPVIHEAATGTQGRKSGARLSCPNLSELQFHFAVFAMTMSTAFAIAGEPGVFAESPLENATAVWDMADVNGAAAENARLTVEGDVMLGVGLEGSEREASLRRGGDGLVAQFHGGYLVARQDAAEPPQLRGEAMTFCIRLCNPSGTWNVPLFARKTPDDSFGRILYPAPLNKAMVGYPHRNRIERDTAVEFLWRTTLRKERVHAKYYNNGEPTVSFKLVVDGENTLCEHPAIAEAAVFGVPDDVLGEAIAAVVVCREGDVLTESEVQRHCAAQLEDFMVPHSVQFRETLPQTDNGKVDKKSFKQTPVGTG